MQDEPLQLVPIGNSDLRVSPIGFGCWPISGVSSLGVTTPASEQTVRAALESGINFFDSAYSYGYAGEADAVLARVLKSWSHPVVIANKVGMYYAPSHERIVDGRPQTLVRHAEELLRRLDVEQLDLLYLHQPDPQVPLAESAGAVAELVRRGTARYAGVCNVTLEQLQVFHRECPVIMAQMPFNMLQPESLQPLESYLQLEGIAVAAYWVLMKGLLAGKMTREHVFDPADRRLTYPIYQGTAWQRAHDLIDELREISGQLGCTVAQLVIAWTLAQPAVDVALCGAKRPEQIRETAQAMKLKLEATVLERLERLVARCRSNTSAQD